MRRLIISGFALIIYVAGLQSAFEKEIAMGFGWRMNALAIFDVVVGILLIVLVMGDFITSPPVARVFIAVGFAAMLISALGSVAFLMDAPERQSWLACFGSTVILLVAAAIEFYAPGSMGQLVR